MSTRCRPSNPGLHYSILDSPGTTSEYCIWAAYDPDKGREQIPDIVLGEGVMIAANGLHEDPDFYKALSGMSIPACIMGLHDPIIGLNREPGLRYSHYNGDNQARTFRPHALNMQTRRKLIELISCGSVIALSTRDNAGDKITLLRGFDIRLQYKHYPKLKDLKSVVSFIDLSLSKPHSYPFWNYKVRDERELEYLGLWVASPDGRVGYWIQRDVSVKAGVTQQRVARDRAIVISMRGGLR